ncbi:uncharacterized protein PV09_03291 [Verruconis gallopava]|uniref:Uncharacterized protein n=2 Tax=Verruconis gallopava TaxID=253628 RepID=A0A0D2B4H0_9PEZI|nr:uncharacterized protein PV09_03291 [Verruconis gallopava]KIW06124.1 hypothetical protein PV09_03291 [Verruconis gallopava]
MELSREDAYLVWLITGCSSGFGEQFVRSAISRGDKVIATARNLDKIRHLEVDGVIIMRLDVTDEVQSINSAIEKAISIHGRIDVLVNNAAYVTIGLVEDLRHEDYLAQFNTNLFGTIKVTQAVLPHFRQRRSGTLLFLSSLSGWIGHPGCSAYAGSKFALEGWAESLSGEVASFGIRTLLVEPGRYRTKLLSSGNMKPTTSNIPDYAEYSKNLVAAISGESGKQPGDPVKLVETVVDLVRGEGIAWGKQIPFRLPMGLDCYDEILNKLEETKRMLQIWGDVIRSTNFDQGNA